MATLSEKTTDGRLAFIKYVVDNPNYKNIEFTIEKGKTSEFYQYKGNAFIATNKQLIHGGSRFKIVDTKLYDEQKLRLAKVKLTTGEDGYVPINKIRKPTAWNSTQYEDEIVDSINNFIKFCGGVVDIKVGQKIYKSMTKAIKVDSSIKLAGGVKEDPKADVIIVSDENKKLASTNIFISHKKAGGPEAFQQYGGVSPSAGMVIYNHPTVQSFLSVLANLIGEGDKLPRPVMMKIKDRKLINMSVFGPDFGKPFGLNHVQIIGQGKPIFRKINDETAELTFEHYGISGDISWMTNGYDPVLGATFRNKRGFEYKGKRYYGARIGIYPSALIAGRSNLLIIEE